MKSENIYSSFGIDNNVSDLLPEAEEALSPKFKRIEEIAEFNQLKVILAMQKAGVSSECMYLTTGYGYDDPGRDTLEKVYAGIFRAEDALVRSQIISGTHAITIALFGILRPGDEILSPTGLPYDTMRTVIGFGGARGSLKEYGVSFRSVSLLPDGSFDYNGILKSLRKNTRLILIQRSRGYDLRPALSVENIRELCGFLRGTGHDAVIMVDNCYGEYTEVQEPIEAGADIIAGSMIKNPGGGIAPVGGYIAGRSDLVALASTRMTAPGLEKEVGPSLGLSRLLYQGTYLAPSVTGSALKGAALAAYIYEKLGFKCSPRYDERQSDIVVQIELGSAGRVISFTGGIQKAAAVDSRVVPEPAPMPGYEDQIIMASGSFISGSSIELSADAPLREPYTVYFQGGLTYPHTKLGVLMSVQALVNDGLI